MQADRDTYPGLHVEYVHIHCDLVEGQVMELSNRRFVIGRAEQSDLHVDDQRVSRQHAEILCEADRWFVVDLGSQNGTFVNGHRLVAGQRQPLKNNDKIQIGSLFIMRFEDPATTVRESTNLILLKGLALNTSSRHVYVLRRKLDPPLTDKQYKLLELLVRHQGEWVSKEEVISHIWPQAKGGVTDQMLDNLVARLRQRLGQVDAEHEYVVRQRGTGLKFVQRE